MIGQVETVKKVLVVVDMINGFINEGALADNGIKNIVEENIRLINLFINNRDLIISTRDAHSNDCEEFKEFPIHCLKDSEESKLIKELEPFQNRMIDIEKNTTNAMDEYLFVQIINNLKDLMEIVVVGCCTDICVLNLALSLKKYFDKLGLNITITVPINAVETFDTVDHNRLEVNEKSFVLMKEHGINVIDKYKGEK